MLVDDAEDDFDGELEECGDFGGLPSFIFVEGDDHVDDFCVVA